MQTSANQMTFKRQHDARNKIGRRDRSAQRTRRRSKRTEKHEWELQMKNGAIYNVLERKH